MSEALYGPMADDAARRHGVPTQMFRRQIGQESNWNPNAVSRSNAKGLAQIIEKWHPGVDPFDPPAALDYAAKWMAALRRQFGSWRLALMAYNWGPKNTQDWQAAGSDPAKIRGETRHYLDVILGPGWPEPAGAAPPPSTAVRFEDFRDPQPAGRFSSTPKGVILHGSRSGNANTSRDNEYLGTARYEVNNTLGLGWNATIGEGRVAWHMDADQWGHNARAASSKYLAVEIAQAVEAWPVTDAQVEAFCAFFRRCRARWPNLPMDFPTHAELEARGETGARDGKTDVFSNGSPRTDELRGRILARLQGEPQQPPSPPPPATDELAKLREENAALRVAVAHLADVTVANAAKAAAERDAALAEAKKIREQFVGPRS